MILIDGYPIDVALRETHTYESDITEHRVERGATISDNIQPLPITVEIEAIVSDTPLGDVLTKRRAGALADPAFFDSPVSEAFDVLVKISERREPITIETSLKVYTSMALKSLVPVVDKTTGKALRFTATFQQVEIVSNARTRIRVSSPANPRAKTKLAAPTAVVTNRPDANHKFINTLSGKSAVWNDERGRYEYSDDVIGQSGPVPASDLGDYAKYDGRPISVNNSSGPVDLGIDGKPLNYTYYDFQKGAWNNTDGTPVTQNQAYGSDPQNPSPWWLGASGGERERQEQLGSDTGKAELLTGKHGAYPGGTIPNPFGRQ